MEAPHRLQRRAAVGLEGTDGREQRRQQVGHELVAHGHEVFVQAGAGTGSSIADEEYAAAGAKLLESADEVWGNAELVLKVKEPVAEEYQRMRPGLVLFTYLHLAADEPDRTMPAAISVGTNPTFETQDRRTVEAYVLDRDDLDLYDERVMVEFTAHIRPTLRFDSVEELLDAMGQDVARCRELLARIVPA